MIIARGFQPADLTDICLQPRQSHFIVTLEYAEALAAAGPAFTVQGPNGDVVACIGLMKIWDGYERAFAFLSADARKHLLSITRKILPWLEANAPRRVDALIDMDFPQAIKWAQLLGFQCEGVMRKAFGERDQFLYARVR